MGKATVHTAMVGEDGALKVQGSAVTLFASWSFTRTALVIGVLRLSEEGCIYLEEPWLGKPFTVRQLIPHRAGVPEFGLHPRAAKEQPLTGWAYLAAFRPCQATQDRSPSRGETGHPNSFGQRVRTAVGTCTAGN